MELGSSQCAIIIVQCSGLVPPCSGLQCIFFIVRNKDMRCLN